jgi:hypothetical protein
MYGVMDQQALELPASLQVSVQPLLPALTVDAIPEAILPHTALSAALPDADWDALRKAAYRRAGYK